MKTLTLKRLGLILFALILWGLATWQSVTTFQKAHDIKVLEENTERICELRDAHEMFHYFMCYEPTAICFVFVSDTTGSVSSQCLARNFGSLGE